MMSVCTMELEEELELERTCQGDNDREEDSVCNGRGNKDNKEEENNSDDDSEIDLV